jgi:hypothetical protein
VEITVKGAHFIQEECPAEVGEVTARFVAQILAGQIIVITNRSAERV